MNLIKPSNKETNHFNWKLNLLSLFFRMTKGSCLLDACSMILTRIWADKKAFYHGEETHFLVCFFLDYAGSEEYSKWYE